MVVGKCGCGESRERETYLEDLSGIDQPLTVSRCVRLLCDSVFEVLHGPVCLYRNLQLEFVGA